MSKSKKLVFFGNERLATGVATDTPTLKALICSGYDVAAIVTSHSQAISRKHRELEMQTEAKRHDIPFLTPKSLNNFSVHLHELGADAGILVAYGQIIPKSVIDIFPTGIINIHPSLLPKYRGPTPIESVILSSEKQTGVSLMKLSPKMDAGPIYVQKIVNLKGSESKQQLADKLSSTGSRLLLDNLDSILDGSLEPLAQDESKGTYTQLISKADGVIDWQKPAFQLEREVRAYLSWPKSRGSVHGQDVIITKARVAQSENDGTLVMKCSPGWLEIKELVAPSGRTVSGADFLRGYQKS